MVWSGTRVSAGSNLQSSPKPLGLRSGPKRQKLNKVFCHSISPCSSRSISPIKLSVLKALMCKGSIVSLPNSADLPVNGCLISGFWSKRTCAQLAKRLFASCGNCGRSAADAQWSPFLIQAFVFASNPPGKNVFNRVLVVPPSCPAGSRINTSAFSAGS